MTEAKKAARREKKARNLREQQTREEQKSRQAFLQSFTNQNHAMSEEDGTNNNTNNDVIMEENSNDPQQQHRDNHNTELEEEDNEADGGGDDDGNDSDHNNNDGSTINYPKWHGLLDPPTMDTDAYADLDWNQEDEQGTCGDDDFEDFNKNDCSTENIMREFVLALQARLRKELNTTSSAALHAQDKWLLNYLGDHGFWVCQDAARIMCKKLSILYSEPAYYQDVRIWIPEIQYGKEYCPPCVSCKSNSRVARHRCFQRCPSRVVVGIERTYHIMTWQYICHGCKQWNKEKGDSSEQGRQYTFMGYNTDVLPRIPDGIGEQFPAVLTYRSGLDKKVIRLLRPLLDHGMRPEAISNLLLELHSLKYTDEYQRREQQLRRKKSLLPHVEAKMFSSFDEMNGYAGKVPTGRYLTGVYKKYQASIKDHLDREVKKRGCTRLHVDGNAKIPKLLCRHNGKPLFKSLMTGTNEYREVRLSAFSVTESHDQLEPAVLAMVKTMQEYGQEPIELVTTDNAPRDNAFFVDNVESVKKTQDNLDQLAANLNALQINGPTNGTATARASTMLEGTAGGGGATSSTVEGSSTAARSASSSVVMEGTTAAGATSTTTFDYDCNQVFATVGAINDSAQSIRDLCVSPEGRTILALDIEFDTTKNAAGRVVKSHKTALMQIGFVTEGGAVACHMYQVARHDKLPDRLEALFRDKSLTFVGSFVLGDLKKVGEDFGLVDVMSAVKFINLGKYARERDAVPSGSVGLEVLCAVVLGETMDKSPEVRLSKWSRTTLADEQKKYAALDAIKSLQIFLKLENLPNLNNRLPSASAMDGLRIEIVPSHGSSGSVSDMATRAAMGTICPDSSYLAPEGFSPSRVNINRRKSCVVKVDSVLSPNLIVPGMKRKGKRVSLGDFGQAPFKIPIPLGMLRKHIEGQSVRTYRTMTTPPSLARITQPSPRRGDISRSFHEEEDENASPSNSEDQNSLLESFAVDEDGELLTDDLLGVIEPVNHMVIPAAVGTEEQNLINEARALGDSINTDSFVMSSFLCEHLDDPPEDIMDVFKAVLADNFHQQKRPRVPVRHNYKKAYCSALMEAFLEWNREKLVMVIDGIKEEEGWTDEEIKAKMFFNPVYFQKKVDRIILPPSKLYWRVRAVYVKFGNKLDHKGKPLFNREAWKKANSVLKEILQGFASDPPGFSFYTTKVRKNGDPMVDKYGFAVLECMRGTNDVELWHKLLRDTFGTWQVGIEMSYYMLAERRHRHNQRMSELHRTGFPVIGHYDTWKVDLLQILVEDNHGVRLYPTWVNSNDWKDTDESFDLVPMHDMALQDELAAIDLPSATIDNFKPDLKFLSQKMGIPLPVLPLTGSKDENKLFADLLRQGPFDAEKMAREWCRHVDGSKIFPTLPVYLRTHHESYLRTRRAQDASKNMEREVRALAELNKRLLEESCAAQAAIGQQYIPPQLPGGVQHPQPMAIRSPSEPPRIVGGTSIALSSLQPLMPRPAVRGPDKPSTARQRSCAMCKASGLWTSMYVCKGRGNRALCEYTG